MSKVITTDWQRVGNGQTTILDLTQISRYLSARVRWRGVDNQYNLESTKLNSSIIPYPDEGNDIVSCSAGVSVTLYNSASSSVTVELRLAIGGGVYGKSQTTISAGGTATLAAGSPTIYADLSGMSVSWSLHRVSGAGDFSVASLTINGYLTQTRLAVMHTYSPSVTVAGQTAIHSGMLTNGQISAWYTLPGLVKGNNSILNTMDSNARADMQIEYTIEPLLPYTVLSYPEHASSTTDTVVEYIFQLTADAENSAAKYHARIRLDSFSTMINPTVYESKSSQTDWSYWNGSAWLTFPAGGVDAGTRVKYKKAMPLSSIYWDTASWDGYTYGKQGTAFKVRVVLSTTGLYALQIGGEAYDAYTLSVVETSNGEIGGISVTLDNDEGAAFAAINFGDTLILAITANGEQEDYEAVVRELTPSGNMITITANTGDGILAERLCKADYSAQDIGLTVAAIITTYCAPLTAANVDTSTGFVAPVLAMGKSPLSILEELRKNYGLYYYVDKNWDLHLYKTEAVSTVANLKISLGEG